MRECWGWIGSRGKKVKKFKEKDKDFKEREKTFEIGGGIKFGSSESLENRLQSLEATVQQLSHFISSANRPDLQASLFGSGSEEADFQKNSTDSKTSKDDKDMDSM